MRKILVDNARLKNARKHRGGQRVAFDEAVSFPQEKEIDLLRLEEALESLTKIDERQPKIVELRFYKCNKISVIVVSLVILTELKANYALSEYDENMITEIQNDLLKP